MKSPSVVIAGLLTVRLAVFAAFLYFRSWSKNVLGPVTFWTSESPRNAPDGFAFVVTVLVPLPIRTPVRVVAPVPPPATLSPPYSTSVPASFTFNGRNAAPLAKGENFVPSSFRIAPNAGVVCLIVLSCATTVLPVRV